MHTGVRAGVQPKMQQQQDDPSIADREFRQAADLAPVLIWRSNADGQCNWVNKAWLQFTGRSLDQERGEGWTAGVHSHDVVRCVRAKREAHRAGEPFSLEYRLRRRDGQYRWLLDQASPAIRDGQFAGFVGVCTDVTAQRETGQQQQLLVHELNHRVQDTVSLMRSLAKRSLGSSPAAQAFTAQLASLGEVHTLLGQENWSGVWLEALVDACLKRRAHASHENHGFPNPPVWLPPNVAIMLAVTLVSLNANSRQQGTKPYPTESIRFGWRLVRGVLELVWCEQDDRRCSGEADGWFRLLMTKHQLIAEFGADVRVDRTPGGLAFTMKVCLPEPVLDLNCVTA